MWVSWKNQHTDFSQPPKFEEKVAIFNAGQEKGSEAIYLLAYDPLSRAMEQRLGMDERGMLAEIVVDRV